MQKLKKHLWASHDSMWFSPVKCGKWSSIFAPLTHTIVNTLSSYNCHTERIAQLSISSIVIMRVEQQSISGTIISVCGVISLSDSLYMFGNAKIVWSLCIRLLVLLLLVPLPLLLFVFLIYASNMFTCSLRLCLCLFISAAWLELFRHAIAVSSF